MPATSVDNKASVSMIPTQENAAQKKCGDAKEKDKNDQGKKKVNTAEEESQRMEYAVVSITVSFKS
jgi:hypothetical protein